MWLLPALVASSSAEPVNVEIRIELDLVGGAFGKGFPINGRVKGKRKASAIQMVAPGVGLMCSLDHGFGSVWVFTKKDADLSAIPDTAVCSAGHTEFDISFVVEGRPIKWQGTLTMDGNVAIAELNGPGSVSGRLSRRLEAQNVTTGEVSCRALPVEKGSRVWVDVGAGVPEGRVCTLDGPEPLRVELRHARK